MAYSGRRRVGSILRKPQPSNIQAKQLRKGYQDNSVTSGSRQLREHSTVLFVSIIIGDRGEGKRGQSFRLSTEFHVKFLLEGSSKGQALRLFPPS